MDFGKTYNSEKKTEDEEDLSLTYGNESNDSTLKSHVSSKASAPKANWSIEAMLVGNGPVVYPLYVHREQSKLFNACLEQPLFYPNLKTELSCLFGTDEDDEENDEEVQEPWYNKYFLKSEVMVHDNENDCWVTVKGIVKNVTPITSIDPEKAEVIIASAGKDISHWFDRNGNIKTFVSRPSYTRRDYLPWGPIPGVGEPNPWWKDESLNVGYLSNSPRFIRITNTLTSHTIKMEVPGEDTVHSIMRRYKKYNSSAEKYMWRIDGKDINMNKTLSENGVPDKTSKYSLVGGPQYQPLPNIMLIYKYQI